MVLAIHWATALPRISQSDRAAKIKYMYLYVKLAPPRNSEITTLI